MAKISLFILIFLLFIFASICEADIEISVRGSYSSYWDYYGDGFFFHTFSMDTVGPNTVLDFNRIIRTDHIGNPQVWISFLHNESFALHFAAGYQRLEYSFRDTLEQSFIYWRKGFEGKLNLLSVGVRIEYRKLPVHPYLGTDIGYGFGNLATVQELRYPPVDTAFAYILVDGKGGGWYSNLNLGIIMPVIKTFDIFMEYDLRLSRMWNPFKAEYIEAEHYDEQDEWLIDKDRKFGFVRGHMFSMGLQYRFNIK